MLRKNIIAFVSCILICACAYRWGNIGFESAKEATLKQIYIEVLETMFPMIYVYDDIGWEVVYRDVERIFTPIFASVTNEGSEVGQDANDEGIEIIATEDTQESIEDSESSSTEVSSWDVVGSYERVKKVEINRVKLQDFDYLRQTFYQVDSSTTVNSELLNVEKLLGEDMTLTSDVDGPQVLIYHTHSQEGYLNSSEGDESTSVVAVGEYLAKILEERYGIEVLHHTGEYDVPNRDSAYSTALPALEKILAENPTIEVVIDLHRDGIDDATHLVTNINGKETAQIMFFNGLSHTTSQGELESLANPYISENLAFSFQMQLAAEEYYPGLVRKIYLKGYRYNMHLCPKSLLVEVGAQTNTLEEAMNAMEPLADILAMVLLDE